MGLKQVEAILRDVNDIPEKDATWFRARLKHLQRVGLVVIEAKGAGRRANYSLGGLSKLAFAVELLQVIPSPERAALLASHNWGEVAQELLRAHRERGRDWKQRYVVIEPSLLRSDTVGVINGRFAVMDGQELAKRLQTPTEAMQRTRVLAINLTALLFRIEQAMQRSGFDPEDIRAELNAQADLVIGGE